MTQARIRLGSLLQLEHFRAAKARDHDGFH
jgi:hypothetical protein